MSLVSVVIPSYNHSRYIRKAVESVLGQTHSDVELIMIDDGSKDRTLEVAHAAFAEEEARGTVLILGKPNAGKASALN